MARFYETVFIGGGLSCLAAARRLRGDSILLERENRPGGLCRSDREGGFTFDRTGHLLHLRDKRVRSLVKRLLGDNLVRHQRNSWIFSHGVYTRYPFQSHFFGLPPGVAAECLLGVIRAHVERSAGKPANFAQWVLDRFGHGVAKHFMFPYNRKLWTVKPEELTTEWLGRYVPRPDLEQVVRGALEDIQDRSGYNASFFYPVQGGIEALVKALARGVKKIECEAGVESIDLTRRRLALTTGDEVDFGRLVSCVALPRLVDMLRPRPARALTAASKLRWSGVYNLNLGVRGAASERHWVYVPDKDYCFYRFGYASNFSPSLAPAGSANIYTEVAYSKNRRIDRPAIEEEVIKDLIRIGVIGKKSQVMVRKAFDLPIAYATYDANRSRAVTFLLDFLEKKDIYSIGRWGRWEYGCMEDAILQGIETAEKLASAGR